MDRGVWWAPVHRVTRVRQELVTKLLSQFKGFAGGSDSKESTYNAGELGSVPGLGRSPGEGNGFPLQFSCPKNSMDREVEQATVHGATKSQI